MERRPPEDIRFGKAFVKLPNIKVVTAMNSPTEMSPLTKRKRRMMTLPSTANRVRFPLARIFRKV